jgi:hypothetical protein
LRRRSGPSYRGPPRTANCLGTFGEAQGFGEADGFLEIVDVRVAGRFTMIRAAK